MQMQKLIYTETHTDKHAQVLSRKLSVVISVFHVKVSDLSMAGCEAILFQYVF